MSVESFCINPIGYVYTSYQQKFGVPRQPGLVPASIGILKLLPEYSFECVRGLSDFEYIWVHFIFHQVLKDGWSPLIRPPRLGGKQKKGVFATRSPHRPNHLGLSLVRLEKIEFDKTVNLYLSGVDFVNETPVIDVKPYLPIIESKPDALSGYVNSLPEKLLVNWSIESLQQLNYLNIDYQLKELIEESIAQDPRPVHQNILDKTYVMKVNQFDVYFCVQDRIAIISQIVLTE